jgi:hypothetical protein
VPNSAAIQRQDMLRELDATKDILHDNLRKMAERGDMLNHLEDKAGELGC